MLITGVYSVPPILKLAVTYICLTFGARTQLSAPTAIIGITLLFNGESYTHEGILNQNDRDVDSCNGTQNVIKNVLLGVRLD